MGPSGDSGGRVRGRAGTICAEYWSARWADKEINITRSNLQERSSDGGCIWCVRMCCPKGKSKVLIVVGVSFGLMCILQSALNVALRLQGSEYQPAPSTSHSKSKLYLKSARNV